MINYIRQAFFLPYFTFLKKVAHLINSHIFIHLPMVKQTKRLAPIREETHRIVRSFITRYQCYGSGSGRIRIIWPDPDPDPYQETLIWIRVPKKNRDKLAQINQNYKNIIFLKKKSLILFNIREL